MYPTVVILMVETQRSMMDVCQISLQNASNIAGPVTSDARPATLGHLSFAAGPLHTTTENEAEYLPSRTLWSQGREEHGFEEAIVEVNESRVGTSG
jgi:hypothetical protein